MENILNDILIIYLSAGVGVLLADVFIEDPISWRKLHSESVTKFVIFALTAVVWWPAIVLLTNHNNKRGK